MTLKEQLAASHERTQVVRLSESAASGASQTDPTAEVTRRASVGAVGTDVTKEKEVRQR